MSGLAATPQQSPNQRCPQHLYIHIPFCHRRCAYCDFNTYANLEDRIDAYVAALCSELVQLTAVRTTLPLGGAVEPLLRPTIFFGGGTPSMLSLRQMEQILEAASQIVVLEQAEVTIEANPGTLLGEGVAALDYLRGLRGLGVNRLSLGVQSLHDPTLRVLGRTHTADEAYQTFRTARQAGFDNINLDFIFGLPGQTVEQWAETLATISTWQADHFALYSLILEPSTPLYAQVMGGRLQVPDDDAAGQMYELAIERFAAAGYAQYEISNWAATTATPATRAPAPWPVGASQHNLAYWLNSDYLAAGAGAHGHIYPQRYMNRLGVDDYIQAVQAGQRPVRETTALEHRDLCAETMFMGLRLNSGVSRGHFRARCGVELAAVYGALLAKLEEQGLLVQTEDSVRLTERGRLLGNQVFQQFV